MGRYIPSVTIILWWILHSCHINSTAEVRPPMWMQKFFGGQNKATFRVSVIFSPVAEVGIELFSGIKMFLISIVALKMLMPQNLRPPLWVQKFCSGHIGPPYCKYVFFPAGEVAIAFIFYGIL